MTFGVSLRTSASIASHAPSVRRQSGTDGQAPPCPSASSISISAAPASSSAPSATTFAVAQGACACTVFSTAKRACRRHQPRARAQRRPRAESVAAPAMPSLPATLSTWPNVPLCPSRGADGQQRARVGFLQHVDPLRAVPFGQDADIRDRQLARIRAPRIDQQPVLGAMKRHRLRAHAPRRRAPAPSRRPRRRGYPPQRRADRFRSSAEPRESATPSSSRLSPVP